ncbi:unnamed protein product, partial [Staurois parvus]
IPWWRAAQQSVVRCVPGTQWITDQWKEPKTSPRQCHLSVSINATCQCSLRPPASAHQCHINATYQCPSELPFSATYQCQLVLPINASKCRLPVLPISAAYKCPSVLPISAT